MITAVDVGVGVEVGVGVGVGVSVGVGLGVGVAVGVSVAVGLIVGVAVAVGMAVSSSRPPQAASIGTTKTKVRIKATSLNHVFLCRLILYLLATVPYNIPNRIWLSR